MHRKFKAIKTVVWASLAVVILLLNVPVPINIETPAMEIILSDPSHYVMHTVRIRGWYRFNFFVNWHGFSGTIEISGYPETHSPMAFSRIQLQDFPERKGLRAGALQYGAQLEPIRLSGSIAEGFDIATFGMLYASTFFRRAFIVVSDNGIRHYTSPLIVMNATTREDAFEMANHYF